MKDLPASFKYKVSEMYMKFDYTSALVEKWKL